MKENIDVYKLSEMVLIRLDQLELILKSKGLAEKTIDRKMINIGMFIAHARILRDNNIPITTGTLKTHIFEYVRDGYFSADNYENDGTIGYRRSIFHNIQECFNWIFEDREFNNPITGELVKDLTIEEIEQLINKLSSKICNLVNDRNARLIIKKNIRL